MATLTEPAAGKPTGALFRALRSAGVEPDLAYRADDEVRSQAGQNVIAVLGAKIDALGSRIDTLQRVIWPLIVLLASTVFGLLYRVFTTG